jgi:hypothetical protein
LWYLHNILHKGKLAHDQGWGRGTQARLRKQKNTQKNNKVTQDRRANEKALPELGTGGSCL